MERLKEFSDAKETVDYRDGLTGRKQGDLGARTQECGGLFRDTLVSTRWCRAIEVSDKWWIYRQHGQDE